MSRRSRLRATLVAMPLMWVSWIGHAEDTRIVTLSPHAAEMVAAAGGAGLLVGVAAFTEPAVAGKLPVVGDARGIDREKIISLQPDLAIAWLGGNRSGDVEWLRKRGIQVYESDPRQLDDIPREIREIGLLIGTASEAALTAGPLEKRISGLSTARDNQAPRRFFFQLWHRPPMTFGADSLVTHALARCAAQNVFGHVPRTSFTPEPEALKTATVDVEIIPRELGGATPLTAAPVTLRVDAEAIYRPGPGFIGAIGELCDELRAASIAESER